MKLQKNTSLALYSVLEFAADPARHIPGADIAEKYGVSSHHLAKVLSELARAGIVESVRGAGGGYRFIGNARRLTLMDIMLPYHDGLELVERLRAQAGWERVPVLMLTAKAREVDIVRALELGADDYVTKPFQPEELLARIRRLMRRPR